MVRFVLVVVSLFLVVIAAAASASPFAAVHRHHHPGKLFIYLCFSFSTAADVRAKCVHSECERAFLNTRLLLLLPTSFPHTVTGVMNDFGKV